jgi:hypothetical protein
LPANIANYRLDALCNIATAIAEENQLFISIYSMFFRIIRMLVIEKYLWEDLVVTRDQMATAYLRPGTKAQLLIQVSSATSFSLFPLFSPLCNASRVQIRIRIQLLASLFRKYDCTDLKKYFLFLCLSLVTKIVSTYN